MTSCRGALRMHVTQSNPVQCRHPNHLTCMRYACTGGGRARPGDAAQPAAGRRGRARSAAAACCAQRRLGPHAAARAAARQVMSISGAHGATKRDPHLDWKERVASQSWCISKGRAESAARRGWARGTYICRRVITLAHLRSVIGKAGHGGVGHRAACALPLAPSKGSAIVCVHSRGAACEQ